MDLPQQRERVSIDGKKGVDVSFGDSTKIKGSVPVNGVNVKDEYDRKATPSIGNITFDDRFNDEKYAKEHQNEIKFAEWLHEYYGGDIHLLGEAESKMPDYLWKNKMWDLKTPTTEQTANGLIKKRLKTNS